MDTKVRDMVFSRIRLEGRGLQQVRPAREAALLAGMAVIFFAGLKFSGILMPAFAGIVLAYISQPAVKYLHRRLKLRRVAAVAVLLAAGSAFVFFAAVSLLPLIIEQGSALLRELPGYFERTVRAQAARYGLEGSQAVQSFQPQLNSLFGFLTFGFDFASSAAFWLFFLPFFFFAFSCNFPLILRAQRRLIPGRWRRRVIRTLKRIDVSAGNFFRGRLIVAATMGFLLAAGWFFAGVPYWFLLGIFTGLIGIAPYLSVAGWAAAVFLKYLQAQGHFSWIDVFVWPSLVFAAANVVEELWLTPLVQSRSVKMSPVTLVLAVVVGGAVGGIGGLLLAIPAASALKIAVQEFFPFFFVEKSEKSR